MQPISKMRIAIVLIVAVASILLTIPTARYYNFLSHSSQERPKEEKPLPKTPEPAKTDKVAWEAWAKLNPGDELVTVILAAVARQKRTEQWTRDGGKFVPYPATWLNQKRWEDEIDASDDKGLSPETRRMLEVVPMRNPTDEELRICGDL